MYETKFSGKEAGQMLMNTSVEVNVEKLCGQLDEMVVPVSQESGGEAAVVRPLSERQLPSILSTVG